VALAGGYEGCFHQTKQIAPRDDPCGAKQG